MERKIGAQFFTIRDFIKTEEDIATSFQKIADIGYTFCQNSAMGDIAPEKLRDICQQTGVSIIGDHCDFKKLIGDTDKMIADRKVYGCTMPGIGGLPEDARTSKEGILQFMKDANLVSDKLAAQGMTFTYHNHAFEFVKVDGRNIMDYILELANDNFKLMVDVFWLAVAGINPGKFIRDYKEMIGGIHFKDLKVIDNLPSMCEIMEGNLDWDDIIAACEDVDAKVIYVEQDRNWVDPFESLRLSYNNLKTKGFR